MDCFKSNGKEISEGRDVGAFKTIRVEDKIDVTIVNGPAYQVEITAGAHIIKNISATVANGTLTIQNKNKCNFVRGYKRSVSAKITVPYIKFVFNDGVGTVRFADDFVQDTLLVRAENSGDIYVNGVYNEIRTSSHGNGDIYMNGSANSLYVYSFGTNFLKASGLKVNDYVFIETYSIGDCFIDASQLSNFEYNIHNNGNIYYKGQPANQSDFSIYTRKGRAIRQ